MSFLGLDDFAFDIRKLDAGRMCERLDEVLERREQLVAHIRERIGPIRERSGRTSELAAGLCRQACAVN